MYVYDDPIDNGYKRIYVSRKIHNGIFNEKITFKRCLFIKYVYYFSNNSLLIHKFTSKFGIFVVLLLFPLSVLIEGFGNIKEILIDYKRLLNEKKFGAFTTRTFSNSSEIYLKIKDIYG